MNTKGGRSSRRAARGGDVAADQEAAEPGQAEPPDAPAEAVPADPAAVEPVTFGEQRAGDPVFMEPVAAEPVAAEPVAAEPVAAEPVAPQPVAPDEEGAHRHAPVGHAFGDPMFFEPKPGAPAAPPPAPAAPSAPTFASPAEVEPEAELVETERCAQCGAPLSSSDIFCPECGFVRQRGSARPRPNDTNVLDPFPWGLPRTPEPVPPPRAAPLEFEPDVAPAPAAVPAVPFADVADVAETRLVPRGPRGDRYVLQFSTGESVSVAGSGLIGRNPVAEPGEYFDTLVAIVDPGRSVSKTHLEFGQDDTSFWVSDRYSGNGTVMREPDRDPRRCDAGKRYRVARGTRVEIGEQFFIVS